MRLDHLAFRTADRDATAKFFIEAFGYKFQQEFDIFFDDEKKEKARCIALEPPEKVDGPFPWVTSLQIGDLSQEYHMPPEIFVSDGTPGSIVYNWVKARGGIGGLHHIAFMVDSVEETMKLWKEKGWAEFSSETPMNCEDLTQVFSKPHRSTGIIFEFIERKKFGFCKDNVAALMVSTKQYN